MKHFTELKMKDKTKLEDGKKVTIIIQELVFDLTKKLFFDYKLIIYSNIITINLKK